MCTTYPDRPRGAGLGETDATPAAAEGHGRAPRTTPHQRGGRRRTAKPPPNVACNSIGRRFNKVRKRCNSNAHLSIHERLTGNCMRNWLSAQQLRRARAAGEVGLTNQRAPRATRVEGAGGAAGPGRASNRRAERSSQRGRRAGGPSHAAADAD